MWLLLLLRTLTTRVKTCDNKQNSRRQKGTLTTRNPHDYNKSLVVSCIYEAQAWSFPTHPTILVHQYLGDLPLHTGRTKGRTFSPTRVWAMAMNSTMGSFRTNFFHPQVSWLELQLEKL